MMRGRCRWLAVSPGASFAPVVLTRVPRRIFAGWHPQPHRRDLEPRSRAARSRRSRREPRGCGRRRARLPRLRGHPRRHARRGCRGLWRDRAPRSGRFVRVVSASERARRARTRTLPLTGGVGRSFLGRLHVRREDLAAAEDAFARAVDRFRAPHRPSRALSHAADVCFSQR